MNDGLQTSSATTTTAGDDVITGTDGNDTLVGGAGADTISGGAGNDFLWSAELNQDDNGRERDVLNGGTGDDFLSAGVGDDVDGGDGIDTLRLSLAGSQTGVSFSTTFLVTPPSATIAGVGTFSGIELVSSIRATDFNDLIFLHYQTSVMTINLGAGNDQLALNNGGAIVNAGEGDDYIAALRGTDYIDGGNGQDRVDFSNAASALNLTLAAPGQITIGPLGTQLINVEGIGGSPFDDQITGNILNNYLGGLGGNDRLSGLGGDDTLAGGAGQDNLSGGDGNDLLLGGIGADTMIGGTGNDAFEVDDTGDIVFEQAGEGNDTIFAYVDYTLPSDVETLDMRYGFQSFGYGNASNNFIVGNDADNRLSGFDGNDRIEGGAGNDVLDGGNGVDVLLGGLGADTMNGGAGDDFYELDNPGDVIFEAVNAGASDVVYAYVDYILPTNVEHLVMLYGNQRSGTGNAGDNIIIGNAQANVIEGGSGYDTLTGNAGSDMFIIKPGFGVDVITDFKAGAGSDDAVLFSKALFSSFSQIIGNAAQVGADTWIGDGNGNTVVLVGVTLGSLHPDDFGFF
ncbi:calcium-binding protein [Sphingomonas humi]|uniref:Calcium-binding protein n=1 Tax=Sphingomonas humi TaxID=335630 RepID=A0ABP7RN96_9SPHN